MTAAVSTRATERALMLQTALSPDQWAFAVVMRRDEHGPRLTREEVTDTDLLDTVCELWMDSCLRTGHADVPIEQLTFRLIPQFLTAGSSNCDGFVLRAETPFDTVLERHFPLETFADIAIRGRHRLISSKTLALDDQYYYSVLAQPRDQTVARAGEAPFEVTNQSPPLRYLSVSLSSLREKGRAVGNCAGLFPVFYTEEALDRAEQFARRGAALQPPVETGAVLTGPLCSCPDTGEFFVVVCSVFEVRDAEEEKFSLSYTSKSWARIQTIMKAMQSQPVTRAYRILGQCHGHNFLPAGGAPPCEACHRVKVCSRTSVFVSLDDRTWSQAVFSRQPWQLCHIFGINARHENVHTLFTLRQNRLLDRGFYIIPDFPSPSAQAGRLKP